MKTALSGMEPRGAWRLPTGSAGRKRGSGGAASGDLVGTASGEAAKKTPSR